MLYIISIIIGALIGVFTHSVSKNINSIPKRAALSALMTCAGIFIVTLLDVVING